MEGNCDLCGKYGNLERHHVFGGANRKLSEQCGLVVNLCHECHNEPPDGVHFNAKKMCALRRWAQKQAMEHYGWTVDDFIKIFGRNYL